MNQNRVGIALPSILCSDFITHVLKHHRPPTTILICSSREEFLKELIPSIKDNDPSAVPDNLPNTDVQHPLLKATIHLIARSSGINLAFVPTLPNFRAYLAVYHALSENYPSRSCSEYSDHQVPLLGVWGLARLHRSTAEHSAQGLSRTLALAVEAVAGTGQKLVLAEPRVTIERVEMENAESEPAVLGDPWKEQVPILNGSIRYGGEERGLAGSSVEVGRIVRRWCIFVKPDL